MVALAQTKVCSVCGEWLGTNGTCLSCFLRIGLEAGEETTDFGDFSIERRADGSLWELGRGAMGVTYRAADKVLNRVVALKVIKTPATASATTAMRERFLREARAAAALRHAHIAGVFQFGTSAEGERCYCAMELVEGETLEALVRREGPLPVKVVLEIAAQVTQALIAAAQRGLVHRDLKPGNIMLSKSDEDEELQVKVIDFGLAKAASMAGEMELTHGGFVGTPAFASPEQFAGGAIDARTDIYALGVTMWFALTGRLPFAGTTIAEIQERQAKDSIPLDQLDSRNVPASLRDLLLSCISAAPAQRPASARDLLAALANCRAIIARRRRARLFAGVGVISITLVAVLAVLRGKHIPAASIEQAKATTPIAEKRVAILPFRSLITTDEGQILGVGMADSLITKLSASRQIAVTSLTSVRRYAEMERDPIEAGRELSVAVVLEGNVQRAGDQIHVTARLIKIADGAALWTGSFDEKFTNVFAVQDAIALRVATALALNLTNEESHRLVVRETDNIEAYRLYLMGRFHWGKLAPPEIAQSIGYFEQAIALDPNYALAYFGLAEAYRARSMVGDLRPRDTFPQASAAARKAIALDPTLAEPHVTLAIILSWFDWDWAGAEREGRRAVELNPNLAFAYTALSFPLGLTGRDEEAIAAARRAQQLDPVSPFITALAASPLVSARRYAEAIELLKHAIELNPGFWLAHHFLGAVYTEQKEYAEALAELNVAVEASHGNSDAVSARAYVWAVTGEKARAQAVLDELLQTSTERYVPPWSIAVVYYGLGQLDQAFTWLNKAYEERDPHLTALGYDSKWDPVRNDPRFIRIFQLVNLRPQRP